MNSPSANSEQPPNERPETAMQQAIRARALQTVQRRPARFWFASPLRFFSTVVGALLLVTVLLFGIDRCVRAFRMLLDLYLAAPTATAPAPDVKAPQMIYLPPISEDAASEAASSESQPPPR